MDNGRARLRGRVAVNRSYRDRNEEWQEGTSFFDIVLWQRAAESFSERLSKGTPVSFGQIANHSWRDDKDQPHTRIEVQVRKLQILEKNQMPPRKKRSKAKRPSKQPEQKRGRAGAVGR